MKRRGRDAYTIYLVLKGGFRLFVGISGAAETVYLAEQVTSDPFQLMIIWTVFQAMPLLFEIPTGVVADVYSRRLSIVIGLAMVGLGLIVEGAFPAFILVLLAMAIGGIGLTFLSGAGEAWIADEIGEERVGQAYLRGTQVAQITFLIGIPIGGALGSVALNLALLLSGLLFCLLAAVLMWVMPEEGFQPVAAEERESWRALFKTLGDGVRLVRGRSVLMAILFISVIMGLSSTGFDNLWTLNMLENITFPAFGHLEPVVWLGGINAVVSILSLVVLEIVRRRVDVGKPASIARALMFLSGATAVCMVIFGITGDFWLAAAVYSSSIALRMASGPILDTWINQHVESSVRATVLSMDNQVNSLGRMVGGPFIGAMGTSLSLQVALVTTGVMRALVAALFGRMAGFFKLGSPWRLA